MIEKVYIIPIQQKCNCDCKFCISKVRNYDKRITTLAMNDKFVSNIKRLKDQGVRRFEITGGGEPFLNVNIQEIINHIRSVMPDSFIKLYTNGRLLKAVKSVDEIDISLADIDDENNQRIMGYKDDGKTLDIIKFYRSCAPKLRLSIPIIKGAIDSKEKMFDLIEKTTDYIDEYVVRPLYEGSKNIDEMFADFDIKHEKVIMEKDNCLCKFEGKLVLWSDGELYTDWTLARKIPVEV